MSTNKFVERLENQKLARTWQYVICWILLRNFLEGVLASSQRIGFSQFSYRSFLMFFVHFPMFYITLFLSLVICLKFIVGVSIKKISSIAGIGLGFITLVPIIDRILNGGHLITYPLRLQPYYLNFFNPFIGLTDIGISPGQRLIVCCIILLIAVYIYLKSRSVLRTISGFVLSAIIILFWGGLTSIIANNIPEHLYINRGFLFTDTQKFASVYGLLLIFLLVGYFFLYDKSVFKQIIASLRTERMIFFGSMTVFGYVYAHHLVSSYNMQPFDIVAITMLFLIYAMAFWLVQIINDFFDLDADRISRPRNPLLNNITEKTYLITGIVLMGVILSLSFIISYPVFLLTVIFIILGFLYSAPLLRLKKVLILATFVHASAVILALAAGFSLFYGSRALHCIPGNLLIPMLISITLGFTAKDINDRYADKKVHIITLPVLLYDEHYVIGRLPMALIIGCSYLVFALFIPRLLLGSLIFAIVTAGIIIIFKRVKELVYFLLLYAFGCYVLGVLLWAY